MSSAGAQEEQAEARDSRQRKEEALSWPNRGDPEESAGCVGSTATSRWLKSRRGGWIGRDPDEDAKWVAARLGVDGTRGLDFRDWSRVGLFI